MLIQAQYLRASAVAALPVFVLMVFLVDQMGLFPGVFGSGGMLAFVVMLLAGGVYFWLSLTIYMATRLMGFVGLLSKIAVAVFFVAAGVFVSFYAGSGGYRLADSSVWERSWFATGLVALFCVPAFGVAGWAWWRVAKVVRMPKDGGN